MITKFKYFFKKLILKIAGKKYSFQPASTDSAMYEFVDLIINWTKLKPMNVFEIGANLAQDAQILQKKFGIEENNVYVFEPHPDLVKSIKERTKFNCYPFAISNKNCRIQFNAVKVNHYMNSGISSLRNHTQVKKKYFKKITVDSWRMDKFIKTYHVENIDFLKLDVEGCTFEVLEGFGAELDRVNAVHLEAEHKKIWRGQKTWVDIQSYLLHAGFINIYFKRYGSQSDSLWVKKKYIK